MAGIVLWVYADEVLAFLQEFCVRLALSLSNFFAHSDLPLFFVDANWHAAYP